MALNSIQRQRRNATRIKRPLNMETGEGKAFTGVDRRSTGSMKWEKYPADVLPMWVADMDFPAAGPIVEALRERVGHGVFGYTLPTEKLIETCVSYFERKWGWKVEPEWIVPQPGLGVVIHTASRHLGDPEKGVVVPSPIYHVFRNAVPRAGRKRVDVRMARSGTGWVLDPEAIRSAAAREGADVLMLCNPHNPTGKVFTKAELEALADLALSEGWTICSGEVHADLILDEDAAHVPVASLSPEVAASCVTMQSPSKAYNVAGLNFGVAVIADEGMRRRYCHGASGQVVSQLNPFGMAAAEVAWGGACDGWMDGCVAHLRSNRDLLAEAVDGIDGLDMAHMQATYLAWIDVSALGLEDPPAHFEAHGLGMSPGADFGDPGFMRLNFGCGREALDEGIRRLSAAAAAA